MKVPESRIRGMTQITQILSFILFEGSPDAEI
jgi:hypothetical protein